MGLREILSGMAGLKNPIGDPPHRPLSHSGHVESQDNKKLCFCMASLALNVHLVKACCVKTKAFYSPKTQHGRQVIRVY